MCKKFQPTSRLINIINERIHVIINCNPFNYHILLLIYLFILHFEYHQLYKV